MVDTILFDLDGTLLQMRQQDFIDAYFARLGEKFVSMGFDAKTAVSAVWAGTKAMMKNDGAATNRERFWESFAAACGKQLGGGELAEVERQTDSFYCGEFHKVRSVITETPLPSQIIKKLRGKNYSLILATNPLFPLCAVESRLAWLGIDPRDFMLITNYGNCSFCKPNPGYFKGILQETGREAGRCMMVGNSVKEDMCAGALGLKTYLITEFLENEDGGDVSLYENGTLAQFDTFADRLPSLAPAV